MSVDHRIIPVLLIQNGSLVKTVRFRKPTYIGDPINAVRIFNTKEVDELIILDIEASKSKRGPDFALIQEIVSEAFMPVAYGGGVSTLSDLKKLFHLGVDKVVINEAALQSNQLIKEAVSIYGSQSIVMSIDVKKGLFGNRRIYRHSLSRFAKHSLQSILDYAKSLSIGEVVINSVDLDGTMKGMDLELISLVSKDLDMPVVALGGVGCVTHLKEALSAGASAVAAGSFFVFKGKHKAVLISYQKFSNE